MRSHRMAGGDFYRIGWGRWGQETGYDAVNGLMMDTSVDPLVLGSVQAGRAVIESIDPMGLSQCRTESLAPEPTFTSDEQPY